MSGITKIIKVPDLGNTPAKVNRLTGVMYISEKHFSKMPPIYRKFVLYHEEGHIKLNTTSEEAADNYAVDELLKRGYPLSEILKSITRVLSFSNPEHYGRAMVVFNKLREYDYKVNGNTRVLTKQMQNKMKIPKIDVYNDQYNYESNAIGAIIAGAGAVSSGVDALKGLFTGGGGKGIPGGMLFNVVKQMVAASVKRGTFLKDRAGIIAKVKVAPFNLTAQQIDQFAIESGYNHPITPQTTVQPTRNNVTNGGGGSAPALDENGNPLSFWAEHKTKIIVTIVVVVVVAVGLYFYKKKKGGK